MINFFIVFNLIILCFIILGFCAWLFEKEIWNNGICKKTGEPWEYFDTDSQGGRGYKSGDEVCWISWPFIDGRFWG